jgi:hypothetical protein
LKEIDRIVTVVAEKERPGTGFGIDSNENARTFEDSIDSSETFSSSSIGNSNVVLSNVLELERR